MANQKQVMTRKELEIFNDVYNARYVFPRYYSNSLRQKQRETFRKMCTATILEKNPILEKKITERPTPIQLDPEIWNLQNYKTNVKEIKKKAETVLKCLELNSKE